MSLVEEVLDQSCTVCWRVVMVNHKSSSLSTGSIVVQISASMTKPQLWVSPADCFSKMGEDLAIKSCCYALTLGDKLTVDNASCIKKNHKHDLRDCCFTPHFCWSVFSREEPLFCLLFAVWVIGKNPRFVTSDDTIQKSVIHAETSQILMTNCHSGVPVSLIQVMSHPSCALL